MLDEVIKEFKIPVYHCVGLLQYYNKINVDDTHLTVYYSF